MTKVNKMGLSWIVVSDFKKAKKFFTEKVGLKVYSSAEENNWIELGGEESDGALLGICQMDDKEWPPGQNAVVTLTVDNIEKATADIASKGVKLVGGMIEVPGHVKMQLFVDDDGNKFQLVQDLSKK